MTRLVRKLSVVKEYVADERYLGLYMGFALSKPDADLMEILIEDRRFQDAKMLLQKACKGADISVSAFVDIMFDHMEQEQLERQVKGAFKGRTGNVVPLHSGEEG